MIKFHHIGVVTSELQKTIEIYKQLNYTEALSVVDEIQLANIVLLKNKNGPMVELISPTSEDSPAHKWIDRVTAGPYHTCYECDDLEKQINLFISQNLMVISDIVPAIAFDNKSVVFLWGNHVGLIELVEKDKRVT